MLQGGLAEGQQPELDPGWVALGLVGHVGPAHERGRAHGGEQVLDQGPVEHLLGRDAQDRRPPPLHRLELVLAQPGPGLRLEAEGGVQVLAHEPVLELGRLAEEVGELLAVLDDDLRLTVHGRRI